VEKLTIVVPLVWTFAPNAHSQPLQNLTVKFAIKSLTWGYEFLGCRKTINKLHCCELGVLFLAMVDLATSTTMTAA
jgi:hypothetical protein